MGRILKFVLVLLGLICLSLLIWFVGPLFAIGPFKPLAGVGIRLFLIGLIFFLWFLKLFIDFWRSKNMNERLLSHMAARDSKNVDRAAPGEEQVDELHNRFDTAISELKKAKIGNSKGGGLLASMSRQYIYQLPWYMFIGAPGSGKTTALSNSGLSFPLEDKFGKTALRGVGGTRSCEWWFTDEAVMLDTAGRYTTQESDAEVDKAEWQGFLGLLKKFRPRQPINGVLLTISVHDLLTKSADERNAQFASFKTRLNELRETLGIRIPVYILVTKMDLLAGFTETFSSLSKEDRAQVWGFTAPYDAKGETSPEFTNWYREEYQALLKRLNGGLPKLLQDEQDLSRRALIYSMPQQFAGLQETLERMIEPLFRPSRYEEAPLLRGVYFTSGTQEGTPLDRVLGAMQKKFQTKSRLGVTSGTGGSGKSFFVQDLLQTVIFPESHLAGRNIRWERNTLIARYIGYVAVLLALLVFAIGWSISYKHNKDYIEEVKFKSQELGKSLQESSKSQVDTILRLLPRLNEARDLADSEVFSVSKPPMSYRYGLYQGKKIASATDSAYLRLLEDGLLPAIAKQVETDLRDAPQDNLIYSYEALKAYLMLYDDKHYDSKALKDWVNLSLQRSLPQGTPKSTFEDLEGHLSKLLDDRLVTSPFPEDEALVARTRDRLQQFTPAQRAYSRLKRQLSNSAPADFSMITEAGPQAELVFVRASGQPLTHGVPGLFTYKGYYEVFNKQVGELAMRLGDQETWIMGDKSAPTASSAVQKVGDLVNNPLTEEVRRLYLNEYAKTWEDYLADIRLIHTPTLQRSIESARILSAQDSPLSLFIKAAAKQTTLVRDDDKKTSLADKAADKIKTYQNDLANVIDSNNAPTTNISQNRPELIVDTRFEALHRLAQAGPNNGPAPIDSSLQLVNELYVALTAANAALTSNAAPPQSDIAVKMKAEAARLPEPLRSMMNDLSNNSAQQIGTAVKASVATNLDSTVGQFCRTALTDRYPFSRNSSKDVTADDFAHLFAPNGLMDDFFQKNLQSMVDTSTKPWSFKKGSDGTSMGGSAGLLAFQRAAVIRDVYFRGGAQTPTLKLEMKPVEMDASIIQFTLDIDGQLFKYSHGPQIGMPITWPGSRGSQQVRVELTPQLAGANGLASDGPWALHRLFDKAQIRPGNAPEKFYATFNVEGRKIDIDVTANTVYNPFRLREMMEFQCPTGL
jgi:type VI secretion system protein ImpL